jgi:hypothetical protein
MINHPPTQQTRMGRIVAGFILSLITISLLLTSLGANAQVTTPTALPAPTSPAPTPPPTYTAQVEVPASDPYFSTPTPLGPGSRYYSEWPQLVAERDQSLSIVWDWGERDQLLYIHSANQGITWTNALNIAGNNAWAGAVGNQTMVADSQGQLNLANWELYGSTYPHIAYRRRGADGVWQPALMVPGSSDLHQKVAAVGVDTLDQEALVLAGHGGENLGLSFTNGEEWTDAATLPLTATSYPNPAWLPAVAVSPSAGVLVVWGDARSGAYQLWSAYTKFSANASPSDLWSTYALTDTLPDGQPMNGDHQYRVSLLTLPDGTIAAAYEGINLSLGVAAKDIYYREWNPIRYGTEFGGWQRYAVRIATAPMPSEAPFLCADGRGQRYLFWQDYWGNLRVVYTYSANGLDWYPIQRVNAGDYTREKHPQCAVSGGQLHVVWDDRLRQNGDDFAEARLYFASRALPDLYPAPATPTPAPRP